MMLGDSFNVMRTISDGEEGRFVAQSIWENQDESSINIDIFVYCTEQILNLERLKMPYVKKGLIYKIYGGISFYQRKEIKDILSYLRILINPNDEEALKRIINYPARGIGATTIDQVNNRSKSL